MYAYQFIDGRWAIDINDANGAVRIPPYNTKAYNMMRATYATEAAAKAAIAAVRAYVSTIPVSQDVA